MSSNVISTIFIELVYRIHPPANEYAMCCDTNEKNNIGNIGHNKLKYVVWRVMEKCWKMQMAYVERL